jgi:DNA-binding NarL/FixJ family response regulator
VPAQIKVTLSDEERQQLKSNLRSRKTSVRLLERSRIVLMAADGVPNYEIAKKLGIDVNTVGR